MSPQNSCCHYFSLCLHIKNKHESHPKSAHCMFALNFRCGLLKPFKCSWKAAFLTHKHLFFHPGFLSVQLFLLQPLQFECIIPVARQKRDNTEVSCSWLLSLIWSVIYPLLLFLWFSFAAMLLLFVFIQLRHPVHLVLAKKEDVLSLILHASHVGFLSFCSSPLEMKNRYVSIIGINSGGGCRDTTLTGYEQPERNFHYI